MPESHLLGNGRSISIATARQTVILIGTSNSLHDNPTIR
jgi:hypothetical protein